MEQNPYLARLCGPEPEQSSSQLSEADALDRLAERVIERIDARGKPEVEASDVDEFVPPDAPELFRPARAAVMARLATDKAGRPILLRDEPSERGERRRERMEGLATGAPWRTPAVVPGRGDLLPLDRPSRYVRTS